MLLHPLIVVAVGLVTMVVIVGYYAGRPVTYRSESTLLVGRIDVPANAVPGYTAANNTLAGSYSRFVGTDEHYDKMAQLAGLSAEQVRDAGDVWASNVPEAAIIRLSASAPAADQAKQMADLAALALRDMVANINDADVEGTTLLTEHSEAAESLARSLADVEKLVRDLNFFLTNGDVASADAVQIELDRARADQEQQQLRVNTLGSLYQENQRYRIDGAILRVLSSADVLGSTKQSGMQMGVVAGIVAGLAFGIGAAWLLTNYKPLLVLRDSVLEQHGHQPQEQGTPIRSAWAALQRRAERTKKKPGERDDRNGDGDVLEPDVLEYVPPRDELEPLTTADR